MKNEVVRIFDDLEALHDFCRFELLPFNPTDLYNRNSKVWQSYEWSKKPRREYGERKEWSNKPRGQNNYRARQQ